MTRDALKRSVHGAAGAVLFLSALAALFSLLACGGSSTGSSGSELVFSFDADSALRQEIDEIVVELDSGSTSIPVQSWPVIQVGKVAKGKKRSFVKVRGLSKGAELVRRSADLRFDPTGQTHVWSVYFATECRGAFESCDERGLGTCLPCEGSCAGDNVEATSLPALMDGADPAAFAGAPAQCDVAMDASPGDAGHDGGMPEAGMPDAGDGGPDPWQPSNVKRSPIAVGTSHLCVIRGTDAHVECLGENDYGQLGVGPGQEPSDWHTPVTVGGASPLKGVLQVSAGDGFTCALKSDGRAYCWGRRDLHQTGTRDRGLAHVPYPVVLAQGGVAPDYLPLEHLEQIVTGASHACAVSDLGSIFCWGENDSQQLGIGSGAPSSNGAVEVTLPDDQKARLLGAGELTTCASTDSKRLFCWGNNESGMAGVSPELTDAGTLGSTVLATPSEVMLDPSIMAVTQIVGAATHFGTLADSYVWTWGSNFFNQLGRTAPKCPHPTYDYSCDATPKQASNHDSSGSAFTVADQASCLLTPQKKARCMGLVAIGNVNAQVGGEDLGQVAFIAGSRSAPVLCAMTESASLYCGGDLRPSDGPSDVGYFSNALQTLVSVP